MLFEPAIGLANRNPAIEKIQGIMVAFPHGDRQHFRGKRLLEGQVQGIRVVLDPSVPRRPVRPCGISHAGDDGLEDRGVGIVEQDHGIGKNILDSGDC